MSYPVPSDHRIEYDRDGSRIFVYPTTNPEEAMEITGTKFVEDQNDESSSTGWNRGGGNPYPSSDERRVQSWVILFPQPMTLTHWHSNGSLHGAGPGLLEWSSDTNDGYDGTWTPHGSPGAGVVNTTDPTAYRSPVALASTPSNVKAVRYTFRVESSSNIQRSLHLYGGPTGESNSLTFWHATEDRSPTSLEMDLGPIMQGSFGGASFRVKNLATELATTSVVVSAEALTDTQYADLVEFSLDESTWTKTVNVGDLDPGQISQVVHMRLPIGTGATVGPKTFRIVAEGEDSGS